MFSARRPVRIRRILGLWIATVALVPLLATSCAPGFWPLLPSKTTVMVYIVGSDLESDGNMATDNIEEMQAAVPSAHLNILLLTGGANKEGWRTVQRKRVLNGEVVTLADLGDLNMGEPNTLKDFILWGQTAYPADRFILVLWDHGGGVIGGFGVDENRSSRLSVPGIRQAIGDAVAVTGKKLDIVGFDACLMATIEVATQLAPFATYLVASEDLEPGPGWDYTPFLNAIATDPHADGLTVGMAIADGYAAKAVDSADFYTLSVVELSKISPILSELGPLSVQMREQIEAAERSAWLAVAGARNGTDEFGADYINRRFSNIVDLGHFLTLLSQTDRYRDSANRTLDEVLKAVRYNVKGPAHPDAGGLSIYMPFHDFRKALQDGRAYRMVPFLGDYQAMVESYVLEPLNDDSNVPIVVSDIVALGSTLSANVTSPYGLGEQYVTLGVLNSPTTATMLGMDLAGATGVGSSYTLSYALDNQWFSLNGNHVTMFFDYKPRFDLYVLSIPALHRPKGTTTDRNKPVNLAVLYDQTLNEGRIRSAWEGILPVEAASRHRVVLREGDIVTPVFLTIDLPSEEITYTYGSEFAVASSSITLSRTPIKPGTYELFFQVRDLMGRQETSESIDLNVPEAAGKPAIKKRTAMRRAGVKLPPYGGFWDAWKN